MFCSSFILTIMLLAQGDQFTTAFSEVTVVAFQEGKPINFLLPAQHKIIALSLELLRSASYEESQAASEKRFEDALRTNHLRLNFRPSYRTTGPASEQTVDLTELVIPISASSLPDYVFMRERGKLRAFAKYDPQSAQALQEMLKQQ